MKNLICAIHIAVFATAISIFADNSLSNVNTTKDYQIVMSILSEVGIPEQAIWRVAEFQGDSVVELDLSTKWQTVTNYSQEIATEDTLFGFKPFKKLPYIIGELKYLRKLNLSGNHLTELPLEIGLLERLEFLSVQNNYLEEIPVSIGNLKKLKHLDLKGNKLRALPISISSLTNLESFNLNNNDFKSIGKEIGTLSSLRYLYLKNNPLKLLPESIMSLRLKSLDIDSDKVRKTSSRMDEWLKAYSNENYFR